MPKTMVHPRLKRILSESSSAVSSPPDTPSDTGKPDPESEEQDPEVESLANSIQKESDGEGRRRTRKKLESGSPGSGMDISDEEAGSAPKLREDAPAADADASSDTQKPVEEPSLVNTPSPRDSAPQAPADDEAPPESAAQSVAREDSPQPTPGPSKSTSRSPSTHSAKAESPVPPSTSVSANRSPAPQPRPSLKIKLKLGARPSQASSKAGGSEEKTRGRRGRGRGKGKARETAPTPITFTLPPRTRADASEVSASSRPSASRSQSSHHSSAESEDAEDADAESENENQGEGEVPAGPDDDAMDVDSRAPSQRERLADDVESEDNDGDIPEDDMEDDAGEDSEVLPGSARPGSKARLTARQAVLASMAGADHVELEAVTSSRKKQLTSEEIALRREETARKRKNMSEKKLEDEKTETINRLLKKQSSRSRAKRSALFNSSVVPTPQSPHSGDEGESDAAGNGGSGAAEQRGTTIPGPVWRWVSNRAGLRFGVPSEVMEIHPDLGTVAGVGTEIQVENQPQTQPVVKPPAICNVSGCDALRKYRLVNDFERGACGLEHLRVLKGAA